MTPLQKVAMGFVIVVVDPLPSGYDALPDAAGWLLVLLGTWNLRSPLGHRFSTLYVAGVISLVVSAATFLPEVADALTPSGEWFVSLPQLVFMGLLCLAIADLASSAEPADPAAASRFRQLVWAVVIVGVVPVVAFASGELLIATVAAAIGFGVLVFFIYALFRISKRDYVSA